MLVVMAIKNNLGFSWAFRLEIANLVHSGSLEELEEILYEWASDEGWFN